MFGNHGLGGLLEEGAHEESPKCLGGNLGDLGNFAKVSMLLIKRPSETQFSISDGLFKVGLIMFGDNHVAVGKQKKPTFKANF